MSRMNRNQFEAARRKRVEKEVRASVESGESEDTILQLVEDWIQDEIDDEDADAASERETFGVGVEDTACIQSADLWGTGEGPYHGRI